MTDSKITRFEKALLILWFVLNLGIGALTVHEYGMSIDEPNNYRYAADTLDAYPSLFGILYEPNYDSSYEGHGPAFVTIVSILITIIQSVFPNVFTTDLWHFSYFVTFQLAGLCLYWLTQRWFTKWTAWAILILFSTQPVLLGHSFINPKDIPFMFLFTLSVVLGFHLVDSIEAKEPSASLEGPINIQISKFQESDLRRRLKFLTYLALALAIAVVFVVFSRQINSLMEQTITYFYAATPDSWAGQLFNAAASHASNISVEDYVTKAVRLFDRLEQGLLIAGVLFFLAYFGLLVNNTTLPTFLRNTWKRRHEFGESIAGLVKSLRNFLHLGTLKIWSADILRALRNSHVLLAGAALGLATGVRAIAPLAGVTVFLYLFTKVRSRAWTTAIAYFLVAGVVTYLAWPHLWGAPIQRYLEGLGILANFTHYSGRVLFNGNFYGIRDLPRLYLPILLNIQLTEPLLLSVYAGLGLLGWRIVSSQLRTDLLLYIGLGFALPMLGLILLNSPLYHNFRQALFLIPPMFMLPAFTLELVFSKMHQSWARILLIAAIALPGVYSSIKLYPYEYVYYNSLVGGTASVHNRFELDYWRTSMREVALKLNELTPPEAKIIVAGSSSLFRRYAQPDWVVDTIASNSYDVNGGYDYAVQIIRWQAWEIYPNSKNVLLIERDGAVLATAKAVRNASVK
jgi:hypothetical protein